MNKVETREGKKPADKKDEKLYAYASTLVRICECTRICGRVHSHMVKCRDSKREIHYIV